MHMFPVYCILFYYSVYIILLYIISVYSRTALQGGLFVCLVFNGTFSTNRLHHALALGKYIM